MQLVLTVISGTQAGRKLLLRAGQQAQIGRSPLADLCIPDDSELKDLHFLAICLHRSCTVRCGQSADDLVLNGDSIREAVIYDGDTLAAGQTIFRVSMNGPYAVRPAEPLPLGAATESVPVERTVPQSAALRRLVDDCVYLELAEEVLPLAEAHESKNSLIRELTARNEYKSALRLRAHWLTKPQAVWWGCECIRRLAKPQLSEKDAKSLAAAETWARDPTEENRRAAGRAAEELGKKAACAFLALAAHWSGGSILPDEEEPLPPDDRLTGQGVTTALILAAYIKGRTDGPDQVREFLRIGEEIADGKIKIPPPAVKPR
jgi:hypothetical protein